MKTLCFLIFVPVFITLWTLLTEKYFVCKILQVQMDQNKGAKQVKRTMTWLEWKLE